MSEIFNSIISAFRERVRNPFFGLYIISWLIVNWDLVIVVIFNDPNANDIFHMVEQKNYWIRFLLPLGTTAAYITISPWIGYGIQILRNKAVLVTKVHKVNQETIILQRQTEKITTEATNENIAKECKAKSDIKIKELYLEIEAKSKQQELDITEKRNKISIEEIKKELESEKKIVTKQKSNYETEQGKIAELTAKINEQNSQIINLQSELTNKVSLERELEQKDLEINHLLVQLSTFKDEKIDEGEVPLFKHQQNGVLLDKFIQFMDSKDVKIENHMLIDNLPPILYKGKSRFIYDELFNLRIDVNSKSFLTGNQLRSKLVSKNMVKNILDLNDGLSIKSSCVRNFLENWMSEHGFSENELSNMIGIGENVFQKIMEGNYPIKVDFLKKVFVTAKPFYPKLESILDILD